MSVQDKPSEVDQSRSHVKGDQVAGNQINNPVSIHHHPAPEPSAVNALEKLAKKLTEERLSENVTDSIVDSLSYYKRKKKAADGVIGLEAKLGAGDRLDEYEDALAQKVLFGTLLEEWSYYASAQEIFAHLLSRINRKYKNTVFPYIDNLPKHVIDELVDKQIVEPTMADCVPVDEFHINYDIALGMYYWLADQCFLRWHK